MYFCCLLRYHSCLFWSFFILSFFLYYYKLHVIYNARAARKFTYDVKESGYCIWWQAHAKGQHNDTFREMLYIDTYKITTAYTIFARLFLYHICICTWYVGSAFSRKPARLPFKYNMYFGNLRNNLRCSITLSLGVDNLGLVRAASLITCILQ